MNEQIMMEPSLNTLIGYENPIQEWCQWWEFVDGEESASWVVIECEATATDYFIIKNLTYFLKQGFIDTILKYVMYRVVNVLLWY